MAPAPSAPDDDGPQGSRREGSHPSLLPGGVVAGLSAMVILATGYGLLEPEAYRAVPELLRETWRAQDAVSLASLPLLVFAWRRARAGSVSAYIVATGLLMWLAYAYAHLAFAVPFTPVFPLYVAILAVAGYGSLDGLVRTDVTALQATFKGAPRRGAAWFLMVCSVGVAGLWLSDIVIGVFGGTPANLHLADLPNPTWVLDLAWVVPAAFAAGVQLLRGRPSGLVVGGVMLVMLTVLSLAMLSLTPFALAAGLGSDSTVAPQIVAFTAVFSVLGAIEVGLLTVAARRALPTTPSRGRDEWWETGRGSV